MFSLSFDDIQMAAQRVAPFINQTPILTSEKINERVGHNVYFKAENLQKVGAFKARGAMNALERLRELKSLPKKIVAYSSGNHAQALAWASSLSSVPCEIFMPEFASKVKLQATRSYGAKVTLCQTRAEAEELAIKATLKGALLIPPFDHDDIICGQGTAAFEALTKINSTIDAVFAPCGGGGLLSGTLLASRGTNKKIKVIGAEPLVANDAVRSIKSNQIFRWPKSPNTLADGAKTLSVSERTFHYLKQLDNMYEIEERDMIYWTQWLSHTLKSHIEPTSSLAMAAAVKWLKQQGSKKNILVILSGGNMDAETIRKIWERDYLVEG